MEVWKILSCRKTRSSFDSLRRFFLGGGRGELPTLWKRGGGYGDIDRGGIE